MKERKMFGSCAVAAIGLLLICMAVAPTGAENEPVHIVEIQGEVQEIDIVVDHANTGASAFSAASSAPRTDVVVDHVNAGENEPARIVEVPGGSLLIDEDGGIDCTARADTYIGPYTPEATYRIVVQCEYRDYNAVILRTARFRMEGPDGAVAAMSIFDLPLINNNRAGTLSVYLTPEGPGAYHWDIACSEGSGNAGSRGDLILS